MREECEHNRPFWECEICGNEKLKTCKFCNHWTQQSFKCDLHPKDIAPFYSDFTCEDWDGETAVIVRKPQMNRSELKVDSADSIPSNKWIKKDFKDFKSEDDILLVQPECDIPKKKPKEPTQSNRIICKEGVCVYGEPVEYCKRYNCKCYNYEKLHEKQKEPTDKEDADDVHNNR